MNKKEEQYQVRKWQILSTALDHFIRYGYYGTSTRKISEEIGISTGLMFHYFENKQALYEALIEIGTEKMAAVDNPSEPAIDFFKHQAEEFFEILSENEFAAKMFVFMGLVAVNSSNISDKADKLMKEHDIITQSIPIIERGQREGTIRAGDAHALSVLFYSSIQGYAEALAVRRGLSLPDPSWITGILAV